MFKKYQEKKYYSITLMLLFMLISTALAFLAFKFANINSANIALIYILALILTARYTNGYWYGIVFALFSVICINYFFTYPYFNLNFTLSGYPVSFILTLTITLITSATTSHHQQSRKRKNARESSPCDFPRPAHTAYQYNRDIRLLSGISGFLECRRKNNTGKTDSRRCKLAVKYGRESFVGYAD